MMAQFPLYTIEKKIGIKKLSNKNFCDQNIKWQLFANNTKAFFSVLHQQNKMNTSL